MYSSEFGGEVVMGCRFSTKASKPNSDPKVTWHWTSSELHQELIRLDNAADYTVSPKYQGRVKLLTEELKSGWAKLQVIISSDVFLIFFPNAIGCQCFFIQR